MRTLTYLLTIPALSLIGALFAYGYGLLAASTGAL